MSAVIDVVVLKKEGLLAIPHEYLLVDPKLKKNYALLTSGKKVEVSTGNQSDTYIEITKGLKEGDKIGQVDFIKQLTLDKSK